MTDVDTVTTVEALDADLLAACADRSEAWRELVIKDTPARHTSYDEACAKVDDLLEMRHQMVAGETVDAS
jgi:hypothetical protein